jgi:hypothetical protein
MMVTLIISVLSHPESATFQLAQMAASVQPLVREELQAETPPPLTVPPSLNRLTRLSGSQIRAALVGRMFTFDPVSYDPLPLVERVFEIIFEDGRMQRRIGYGNTAGRWRLDHNRLCLSFAEQPERCRYIYRSADGRLFVVRQEDASRTPYPISRWGN